MSKSQYISVRAPGPYADFAVSPTSGFAPLTVKCTDMSSGSPFFFSYDFGDGTSATGPDPVHTYTRPGVYDITLTVIELDRSNFSIQSRSVTKKQVVTVRSVPVMPLEAKFSASPVQGTAPLTVRFTDQSTGNPTFYSYDFGDGLSITGSSPVHTYSHPGTYTVTLTVVKNDASTGSVISDTFVQDDLIVVQG